MLLGTILYLPTLKTTIVFMYYEVWVSPDKKVVVWVVREADEFIRNGLQQCREIHVEHAGDDTFMLGLSSFRCLHWGPEHGSCAQGRFVI